MALTMPTGTDLEQYIRRAAIARGVSPDVAVAMAKAQGLKSESDVERLFPSTPDRPRENYGRGVQVEPAGGYSTAGAGTGIFGQLINGMKGEQPTTSNGNPFVQEQGMLDYGGVPFGTRMHSVGEIFSALGQGRRADPNILGQVGYERQQYKDRMSQAKEWERQQRMAESIASNLEATNPMLADAIRQDPTLVKDYMKGEMEFGYDKKLADLRFGYETKAAEKAHGYNLDEIDARGEQERQTVQLQSDNDPRNVAIREWTKKWNAFAQSDENATVSTLDLYKRATKDPNLTETEAARLAGNNSTENDFWEEYGRIIDDRGNKMNASANLGANLSKDFYITNPEEVARGLPPKAAPIEGTETAQKVEATEEAKVTKRQNEISAADVIVSSIGRIRESLDRQEKGESLTGAGSLQGIAGALPLATEAGNVYDELNTIRANLGFEQLQKMRDSSPTGGALGPVSDYENRLLQGTVETLNQNRDPDVLKARLERLEVRYRAVMTPSDTDPSKSVAERDAQLLRQDPSPEARSEFDEIYGEGAAAIALGAGGGEQ